jgi:histidyl-tRNA synthetase
MSEQKNGLVVPQTLKGFKDILPSEMIVRNTIIDKIKDVYEKYGFVPIDTPILEYLATLIGTGGEETNKQIFKLVSPENEPIAMRFDLTVPFARLVAQYPEELKMPFRRYHIGPVFRADKPGPGRFRQFTQFDIDAAGSDSMAVDAEIIAAMCDVMKEVGLNNDMRDGALTHEFQVKINNRKLVDALLEWCGITESAHREVQKHILRVIDKLQKVGIDEVRKELGPGRVDESGDPIKGVGLSSAVIDKILEFISITGDTRGEVINGIAEFLPNSDFSASAIQQMRDLAAALDSLGVAESDASFEPSLTRGLDYYTGPVFEASLINAAQFGSVMGGGRYDQLVNRFLNIELPATGVSIGIDRFMAALLWLGKVQPQPTTTKVLVLSMSGIPVTELLGIASQLRKSGIASEVYFGQQATSVRDQLSFANAKGIPIALILGEDELKSGQISVKDLKAGMQQRAGLSDRNQYLKAGRVGQVTVTRDKLVQVVKDMLGGNR